MIVTPIMRELHEAHKARLARIAARAYKKPAPPAPAPVPDPVVEARKFDEASAWLWAEAAAFRQSQHSRSSVGAIKLIRDSVCRHFSKDLIDLISRRRTADIILPRQVAAYLCRLLTTASLPQIGKYLGGRDHTTILHAYRKVSALRLIMPELNSDLIAIRDDLGARGVDVSRLMGEDNGRSA